MSKTNNIEDCGDYIKIFFFNCDDCTIIDKEDYDKVKDFCWYRIKCNDHLFYSSARNKKISAEENKEHTAKVRLHRLILPPPEGFILDHKNRDGLDNRKSNLRIATLSQNRMNTSINRNNSSGYKGVNWSKKRGKWEARIQVGSNRKHLGFFQDIEEAIRAREEAEEVYFGEYSSIK